MKRRKFLKLSIGAAVGSTAVAKAASVTEPIIRQIYAAPPTPVERLSRLLRDPCNSSWVRISYDPQTEQLTWESIPDTLIYKS